MQAQLIKLLTGLKTAILTGINILTKDLIVRLLVKMNAILFGPILEI